MWHHSESSCAGVPVKKKNVWHHSAVAKIAATLRDGRRWPEHGVATHEEKLRLEEERRFGGVTGPTGVTHGPGDAVFFAEQFVRQ